MALLNFKNVPAAIMSGLDTECLEWVSVESNERIVSEISSEFWDFLQSEEIKDIPEEISHELKELEDKCIPKSTREHMTNYFKRFVVFLREKQLSQDFENIPKTILNNYLRYFYSQLKSPKSRELYSPCTLVCIRAGLHRYFMTQRLMIQRALWIEPNVEIDDHEV